jgi:predicted dehydrogenase/threonine dehydrogenase-like Zn-dependent dehydrogenase
MKQVIHDLRNGGIELADVPCPQLKPKGVLIRTRASLISAGTERAAIQFGKAGWIDRARQQPDKVRLVLDKVRTDGLLSTVQGLRDKLAQPLLLGYCNAGLVLDTDSGVTDFRPGDRVVSNGYHAEVVSVPANLCAHIPENVGDDAAAITVIGAVALQGLRLAIPELGETFVVIGLGIVGLITVQLLRLQGCRVIGIDFNESRLRLAASFGAEVINLHGGQSPVSAVMYHTRNRGADGVLITAATQSDEPMEMAPQLCRKRGRIVLVGVAGLNLSRTAFYEKEVSFQVSCSYGPGRYDPEYEERGHDYPFGYVRWTAQRNFEAVLDMLGDGRLDVAPLISHRIPLDKVEDAYALIESENESLGVLISYPPECERSSEEVAVRSVQIQRERAPKDLVVTAIGAGNYASRVLFPAFRAVGAQLQTVVSRSGVSSFHSARRFGFAMASTDPETALADERINTVVIATRHDSHAEWVCQALRFGKHVFVEKPLAITADQVDQIERVLDEVSNNARRPILMVGFNRRFAPHVSKMKELLVATSGPKSFILTVNAGAIPANHWTQDASVGGGRIVGEACHFVDLLRHLAGTPIVSSQAVAMNTSGPADTATITLTFVDGSVGAIHYFANGHKKWPKERLEVFCDGRILEMINFRRLTGYGWPRFKGMKLWRQDKGNAAAVQAFADAVVGGSSSPIPVDEIFEVARATLRIAEMLRPGATPR